jgi:mobilization protein NikA
MVRPRKSDPRSCQLNLSLTEDEMESIKRRARTLGMRTVDFSRALVLNSNSVAAPKLAASNLERLNYSALIRLGNNLNQMMRYLHHTGAPVPADLEPLLGDIRRLIERSRS